MPQQNIYDDPTFFDGYSKLRQRDDNANVLFEAPALSAICEAGIPILYAGILSCGVAYTLQILGQRDTPPTLATLLMSLESVFAALTGWLILHERLSLREAAGCFLVFTAVTAAQLLTAADNNLSKDERKVQE